MKASSRGKSTVTHFSITLTFFFLFHIELFDFFLTAFIAVFSYLTVIVGTCFSSVCSRCWYRSPVRGRSLSVGSGA
jgi:hypothetical protein